MCIRDRKTNLETEIAGKEKELNEYTREAEAKREALLELEAERGNVDEVRPVSYTHLDVYTRQVPYLSGRKGFKKIFS